MMSSPHGHNDIEINYCTSPVTYDSSGRASTLPAHVPFAFWGAKPHQLIDIEGGRPLAFVTIPLARFMGWRVPAVVKNRLLQGNILVASHLFRNPGLETLWDRWATELHAGRESQFLAAGLEIEALLVRMSQGDWAEPQSQPVHEHRDVKRAADMATFIASNVRNAVRVADVARAIHLQPNRAATVFRQVFGVGITTYVGQLRVAQAQRLLLTTDLTAAAVGTESGFQSSSSYHETFMAICGATPTQWRRQHQR